MSDNPFGRDRGARSAAPIQDPASVAYTRKDFSVHWDYYPEDIEAGLMPERKPKKKRRAPDAAGADAPANGSRSS